MDASDCGDLTQNSEVVYRFFTKTRAERLNHPVDPRQNSECLHGRSILLAIHAMHGGGSERQMACLANHLARDRSIPAVTLVTVASRELDAYPLDSRIERLELHSRSTLPETNHLLSKLYYNLVRVRKLQQIASRLKPTVVVSFCDMNNTLTLLALGKRYPTLISERSDPRFQEMPAAWERIRRHVYRRAKVCVAQTDTIRDFLKKEFFSTRSKTKFLTIPSAIESPNINWNELTHDRAQQTNRLLFVGRLAPEKQIDKILQAWKTTYSHVPNWKLRIVGQGPLESDLKLLAKSLAIEDSIEWAGWIPNVWEEYRYARAFIMASRYEGFPQSLIEALTMGLPCFVTNFSPAINDCIEHNESGFVLSDLNDLTRYLKHLDDDPLLEQRINTKARMVARRYQWSNLATSWEEAIASAIPK